MSAKPAVVLLPGLGFSVSALKPLQECCEKEYPVMALDYETDSFDAWLTRCEKLLPEKVHLVGWSLGGLLAWKLAQHFPGKVLSVASFSTSPCFLASENWPGVSAEHWVPFLDFSQQERMRKQLLRLQGDRQAVRELKEHLVCLDPPAPHSLRPPACPGDPVPAKSWQWGLEMLAQCDEREWLQQTALPTQLVLAEQDSMLPVAQLASVTNAVVLPNAGHACVYTHPKACFQLLQGFWHEH